MPDDHISMHSRTLLECDVSTPGKLMLSAYMPTEQAADSMRQVALAWLAMPVGSAGAPGAAGGGVESLTPSLKKPRARVIITVLDDGRLLVEGERMGRWNCTYANSTDSVLGELPKLLAELREETRAFYPASAW